jgi:hypothetical protein
VGEFTHVIASTREDLDRVRDVLLEQDFLLSEIRHDPKHGFVDLVIRRKFPPHKGTWLLRIPWVSAWRMKRGAPHDRETLKELSWDGKSRTLRLKGVMDEYDAVVERLDLRLARVEAADPAKVKYEDLPEWLRKEIEERRDASESEQIRVQGVTRGLALKGTLSVAAFSLFLGTIQVVVGLGRPVMDFAVLPLVTGTAAWIALTTGRDQHTTCYLIGFPGIAVMLAALTALHQGTLMIAFCGGLLHFVAGQVLVVWIKGEREMKV